MPPFRRLIAIFIVIVIAPFSVQADEGRYPIRADDGGMVANHRVPAEIESRIEKLPGIVIAGNPHGKVTLAEFYDVNCPYCRAASADIDAFLHDYPELRLVLVPFPVLGIPSIQATRVELAVARLVPARKFYAFHRQLDATRAKAMGLNIAEALKIANEDSLAEVMTAHLHVGDALAIEATPGFVIKGVVIVGYPGAKALAKVIQSALRCGNVVCPAVPR
jgi:protein-disulfide isomerase